MKRYSPNPVFTRELIAWYHLNRRDLPWRSTKDPYKIWLSEIILQQTRVAQGLPYFERFVAAYPTLRDLALAPQQEVLRLWQGLGYYSRARNLHQCAQVIFEVYHGEFPTTYKELLALPGIGDYTASAIASFAFGQATPVVDGNVFRVLARVFGITSDITLGRTRKQFKELSAELIDARQPDLFNQAIMEFGALQCTPRQPQCGSCPFRDFCHAKSHQLQSELPVKQQKVKVRDRFFNYYLIRYGDGILMKERQDKDIWQGLYDFFLLENTQEKSPLTDLEAQLPHGEFMERSTVYEPSALYKHKLSHQHIHARFIEVKLNNKEDLKAWEKAFNLREFDLKEIHKLPKPILIDNYLKAVIF